MFSRRTAWERSPNPIAAKLEALRAGGARLMDLTESNPTRCGFEYPETEILAALSSPAALIYEPDPRGLAGSREALVAHLARTGVATAADRVFFTASTSEAYAFLFKLLCEPGDDVLVPNPCYPLFDFLTRLESVETRSYPLFFAGQWRLDVHAVRAAATPRTRAVLVVNPGNPTGAFLKRGELDELWSLCAERSWALVSDEVFADYGIGHDPERVVSVSTADAPALTFSLGGLSKSAGLPQMKLAWTIASGPHGLLNEALERLELVSDAYLSVGGPVQRALPALLEIGSHVAEQIRRRVERNRAAVTAASKGASWSVLPSEGGWYAVLRIPLEPGEEATCLRLLDAGVLVHPGHFFDFPSGAHLVVSLIVPQRTLDEGLKRLVQVLSG